MVMIWWLSLHNVFMVLLQVKVGNLLFSIGYLKYEHNFWENLVFRYSVCAGIAGIILLIILLVIVIKICKRHQKEKKQKKHPYLEMGSTKAGNNYIAAYNTTGEFLFFCSTTYYSCVNEWWLNIGITQVW